MSTTNARKPIPRRISPEPRLSSSQRPPSRPIKPKVRMPASRLPSAASRSCQPRSTPTSSPRASAKPRFKSVSMGGVTRSGASVTDKFQSDGKGDQEDDHPLQHFHAVVGCLYRDFFVDALERLQFTENARVPLVEMKATIDHAIDPREILVADQFQRVVEFLIDIAHLEQFHVGEFKNAADIVAFAVDDQRRVPIDDRNVIRAVRDPHGQSVVNLLFREGLPLGPENLRDLARMIGAE